MDHWLSKVLDLLQVETKDLRELARLAGGDPKTFYRGARLNGADLTGQDLRGMEFTDLLAADVIVDEHTKVDAHYAKVLFRNGRNKKTAAARPFDPDDPLWADKWLRRSAAARAAADREELNGRGEDLLRLYPAVDENWPRVWLRIWSQERKASARRQRLRELALATLAQVDSGYGSWLLIFRRLWKDHSIQDRSVLESFLMRTLSRFQDESCADQIWIQKWSQLWQASTVSTLGRDWLLSAGTAWVLEQGINHPGWSRVWKRVANASDHTVLQEVGMAWLKSADPRTQGWPSVWRGLWRRHTHRLELLRMAESWLNTQPHSEGWIYVWQDLLKHFGQSRPSWLREAELGWLGANRTTKLWTSTWRQLRENADQADRDELIARGREWLRENPNSGSWGEVWLDLWNLNDLKPDEDLRMQAEQWLSRNLNSHTAAAFKKTIANIVGTGKGSSPELIKPPL